MSDSGEDVNCPENDCAALVQRAIEQCSTSNTTIIEKTNALYSSMDSALMGDVGEQCPTLEDCAENPIALNLDICPECHSDKGKHLYDHLFTVHSYSKDDVTQVKKQRRRWKLFSTASAAYICDVCELPYKSKKALVQHKREKNHLGEGPLLRLLLCPICDEKVENRQQLINHVDEKHAAFLHTQYTLKTTSESTPPLMCSVGHVTCPECYKSLKREHVGEHAIFVHKYTNRERQILLLHLGVEITIPVPELSFKCEHCSRTFGKKRELSVHITQQHPEKEPFALSATNGFACFFDGCFRSFIADEDFVNHCAKMHSIEAHQRFKILDESFDNTDEFMKWKSDLEKETDTSFRFRCTSSCQTMEYECAIPLTSNNEHETQIKEIPKRCTAFLKCRKRSDGTVEAIGCTDHVGHRRNLDKLLSEEQKDELAQLMSKGIIASEIVTLLKMKFNDDPRIHQITCSDIELIGDPSSPREEPADSDSGHICAECEEGPMSLQKLRDHTLEVHGHHFDELKKHEKVKDADIYYSCLPCRFFCFTETVMDAHLQRYHPIGSVKESFKSKTPIPGQIFCPRCRMVFKTNYQLAVHCVNAHGTCSCNAFIVQTSFASWTQFQPWLEKMENDTKSVLIKSGMQTCGTKLIHSYNCQYDIVVLSRSSPTSDVSKFKNCPAFVKVIENEDGVLDCVGFFDHLGHDEISLVSTTKSKGSTKSEEPCFLCGNVVPPEVDAFTADCVTWVRCNIEECRSLAHDWCVQLLGKKCMQCENGMLIAAQDVSL